MIKYTSYIEGMHKSADEEISMEVKLIAMTDAMYDGKPAGALASPEQVCNHSAKTCTSEDAGTIMGTWYVEDERIPIWNDLDMKPLRASIRAGHTSILEHTTYTFEIKGVSRVLETQLVRHRIGTSFAIQSGRYNARDPTNYVVPFDTEGLDDEIISEYNDALRKLDDHLKEKGIKAEDRRYFYPQGLKTNIIMTMNGRELLHWLSIRLCNRAQKEHRELAKKILKLVKEVSPIIFENAGPSCVQNGYCPEGKKGCGKCPTMKELLNSYEESHGKD